MNRNAIFPALVLIAACGGMPEPTERNDCAPDLPNIADVGIPDKTRVDGKYGVCRSPTLPQCKLRPVSSDDNDFYYQCEGDSRRFDMMQKLYQLTVTGCMQGILFWVMIDRETGEKIRCDVPPLPPGYQEALAAPAPLTS